MILRRLILVLLLALTPLIAFAQSDAGPLDGAARAEVGDAIAHALETMYVVPEKGMALAKDLRARFAHGDYDSATTASALAVALTRDLSAANDRHLNVRAGMPVRSAGDSDQLRRDNFGFQRVEHLEANIGYLRLGGFVSGSEAQNVASGAMAFLANSDAIVIDLRDCPGGSTEAVSYLASYFFGPEPRVLMNRYHRPTNTSMQSTTVSVPGRRLPDTPLYVLVGPHSASACESFSYTLQQWGRAKIVGERTAGAGYNNELLPVGHGLVLSISVGTAIHPQSKKGWEAVGVEPDIAAPADTALDVVRTSLLRAKYGVQPAPATASVAAPIRLEDYPGTYGNKEISIRDGALYYQRIGGRGGALRRIDGDAFDLNGEAVVRFLRGADGKVARLRLEWSGHPTEELPRTP
jgi:retinol-binding protein 3